MTNKKKSRVGFEAQYDPRLAGEILHDYLENSNEPLAVAYREHKAEVDADLLFRDFYPNTEPGIDLKLITRKPGRIPVGDSINCMLTHDGDFHYTAVETLPWMSKRNPRVYSGKYINITRRDDGTLRPNFKPLTINEDFSVERYAFGVYRELHQALEGLVEKGDV